MVPSRNNAARNIQLKAELSVMQRFFFDLQFDNEKPSEDEEGTLLPDVEAAQLEAARSLSDFSRAIVDDKEFLRKLTIHVRDDSGPVMVAVLRFEIKRLTRS
jgi:hypothetical protein